VTNRFLQNNCINKISGLECLTELHTLNLSNNRVSMVEGLSGCGNLRTLNLSSNSLTTLKSIAHLAQVKKLQNLDLSKNRLFEGDDGPIDPNFVEPEPWEDPLPLDDAEKARSYALLGVLESLPNLRTLYLKGNPIVNKMERYRKNAITRLVSLHYLDDRPITSEERLATEAWAQGGNEAEREEKLRQMHAKEQTYEDNFAALRAKQEVARVKYAREKEAKIVFTAAAEAAARKGLGAHNVDQSTVEAIMAANAFPTGVPGWQAVAMEAPKQPLGAPVPRPPSSCGTHCEGEGCHAGPNAVADDKPVPVSMTTPFSVKSIEALYEFADGIEGLEPAFDFPLPKGWEEKGKEGSKTSAASKTKEWLSVGMKDARAHEKLTNRTSASDADMTTPHLAGRIEEAPWAGEDCRKRNCHEEAQHEEEAKSPEKSLEELASNVKEGEVNFFQMAKDMCREVRTAAQEMQYSFQELDFNKPKQRKKLIVLEEEEDSDDDDADDADDDDADSEEEIVFPTGKENSPHQQHASPSGGGRRSALREARLAAAKGGCGGSEMDVSSTQNATGGGVDAFPKAKGLPPMARAPRVVSKKHVAENGGRPHQPAVGGGEPAFGDAFALD